MSIPTTNSKGGEGSSRVGVAWLVTAGRAVKEKTGMAFQGRGYRSSVWKAGR